MTKFMQQSFSVNLASKEFTENYDRIFGVKCGFCDGTGTVVLAGVVFDSAATCTRCDGTGRVKPPVTNEPEQKP